MSHFFYLKTYVLSRIYQHIFRPVADRIHAPERGKTPRSCQPDRVSSSADEGRAQSYGSGGVEGHAPTETGKEGNPRPHALSSTARAGYARQASAGRRQRCKARRDGPVGRCAILPLMNAGNAGMASVQQPSRYQARPASATYPLGRGGVRVAICVSLNSVALDPVGATIFGERA